MPSSTAAPFFEGNYTPTAQVTHAGARGVRVPGPGIDQRTTYTTDPRLDPNTPLGFLANRAAQQYGTTPDKLSKAQFDSYANQYVMELDAQGSTAWQSFKEFAPKAVAFIAGGAALGAGLAGGAAAGAAGGEALGGYGGLEAYGGAGAMGGVGGLGAGAVPLAEGGLASLGAATDLGGGILGATGEYVAPSLVGGTADTFAGVDGTGFLGNGVSSGATLGTTEGITQGASVLQGAVPAATGGGTLADLYKIYQDTLGQLPPGATTAAQQLLNSDGDQTPATTQLPGTTPVDTAPPNNSGNVFDPTGQNSNGPSGVGNGDIPTSPNSTGTGPIPTSTAGKWSRIFDGTATADDWASVLGTVGSTALGVAGSNAQSNALTDIYNQQRADRAPALAAYNNALLNPDTFYNSSPAMGATDAVLRKLSVGGNPAANPGDLSKAAAYNFGGYNSYLSGLAGPAFGGQATQASVGSQAAAADGGLYNALGYGLGQATAPDSTLQNLLKQFSLNTGKSLV